MIFSYDKILSHLKKDAIYNFTTPYNSDSLRKVRDFILLKIYSVKEDR